MRRARVVVIIGTRPEAIKLAPVVRALRHDDRFDVKVVATAQHRQMLDQMLSALELVADIDLDAMRPEQTLPALTSSLVAALGQVLHELRPEAVVVQGDTTSTLCGALCAFYEHIRVAHVEAGLRTHVLDNPFPEEANRQLVSRLATWNFAPTQRARQQLLREAVRPSTVEVTGNTVIDNLLWAAGKGYGESAFATNNSGTKRKILVTLHRRENQGSVMREMAAGLRRLADTGTLEIVLPLHKSPAVRNALAGKLERHPAITLTEPLDYFDFVASLQDCDLVLTDSGGVQEEAPTFAKPVLVLRETTERPEAIETGAARLIGIRPDVIEEEVSRLLNDPSAYSVMAAAPNPFGDGRAAERISARLASDITGMRLGPREATETNRGNGRSVLETDAGSEPAKVLPALVSEVPRR